VIYESLEQTTSYWVGEDKQRRYNMEGSWQEAQSNPRTGPGLTYSQGASRDSRSSMYKVYTDVIHMKRKDWDVMNHLYNSLLILDYLSLYSLYDSSFVLDYLFSLEPDNLFPHLIVYFLCRLKINHDSGECFPNVFRFLVESASTF
jgi:hypothetical protein